MTSHQVVTCAHCGLVFTSEWGDEEAVAEAVKVFGSPPPPGTPQVCEDCYLTLMAAATKANLPRRWDEP